MIKKLKFKEFFKYVFQRTGKTCWILFKMIIPISIIIRIIQKLNILPYISQLLQPVMELCDLPAETALVWITTMIVNIYGGILSLISLYPSFSESLTVAQLTVLLTMMLVAHNFPIELKITQKAGAKLIIMFFFRFLVALLFGIVLTWIYSGLNILQEPAKIPAIFNTDNNQSWGVWALNELKHYVSITIVIFSLITLLKILEITGLIEIINKALRPLLKWIGIGDDVLPVTIIGLTLGVAYGGGLIIDESQRKKFNPKDIFYSLVLMGMFHSIIEDTFLMLSVGGHYSGIIIFRFVFSFLVTYILVLCTKKMSQQKFIKLFITKQYAELIKS